MTEHLFSLLDEKISDYKYLKKEIKDLEKKKKKQIQLLNDLEKARSIFQAAAKLTQNLLSEKLSLIVSNALAAVFDDPYTFVTEFVERRNSTECDLLFEKDGNKKNPLDSCGYGAADIASLASRIGYWKLLKNSRNVFILDEPTRNLSLDKQPLASMIIKKLSEIGNGIQFIIVTHKKALTEYADRVFEVKKINGRSQITLKEKEKEI